jgi:hypothetical protein
LLCQNSEKNSRNRGYPGSVRRLKKGLRGIFNPALDRIGIKSSKIEALESVIHNKLACFEWKFKRPVFEGTTSFRLGVAICLQKTLRFYNEKHWREKHLLAFKLLSFL